MIVKINNYELDLENIVNFYPCDILGNYQEQTKFTLIEEKDGFKGIYFFNTCELLKKIEEKAKEHEQLSKKLKEFIALKGGAHE